VTSQPRNLELDLRGRVAVVTGGSRGIGAAISRAYAAHGADLVIASRKREACEALAAEIRQETGRRALGIACHVGRWSDCDALADAAYAEFGRIDVLVNNAGMSPLYPSLDLVSEELFDKVIGVNLKGPFRLAARIGTRMKRDGRGSIINVSSIAAVQPTPTEVPYAAAKAGLNNLTIALAQGFGPEVRVNCIMPGPFLTDISKAWSPDALAQLAKRAPLGRAGQPEEVVGAALYLASDASSYTTGAVIKIDGGTAHAPA
jgi:NAD(P)-dependent dehydrogenase (short-subunit alcohol dehydrogenase family)